MTPDELRKTPGFYANTGDVSTISPASGLDNSKTFTMIPDSALVSLSTVYMILLDDVTWVNLRVDFETHEEAMAVFNKNEWQDEVCPPPLSQFDVTSCSYIDGDEYADCRLSVAIDFSKFTEIQTNTELICSPLLYSSWLTHINFDTF